MEAENVGYDEEVRRESRLNKRKRGGKEGGDVWVLMENEERERRKN